MARASPTPPYPGNPLFAALKWVAFFLQRGRTPLPTVSARSLACVTKGCVPFEGRRPSSGLFLLQRIRLRTLQVVEEIAARLAAASADVAAANAVPRLVEVRHRQALRTERDEAIVGHPENLLALGRPVGLADALERLL